VTQIVYVFAFLLFDREAGRVRPSALAGLGVVALTIASHLWLSGPWLEQAGFPALAHSAAAASARSTPAATCGEGRSRP
jgi:hypothetical protein